MVLSKYILFDVENKYKKPSGFGVFQLILGGVLGYLSYVCLQNMDWYLALSELISINFIKALTFLLSFILFCCFFDLAYEHRNAFKVAFKSMVFIVITTGFAASVGLFFAWYANPLGGIDLTSFISSDSAQKDVILTIPALVEPLFSILKFTKAMMTYVANITEISILYILIFAIVPVLILHFFEKKNIVSESVLQFLGKKNEWVLDKIIFKWLKLVISTLPIIMIFIVTWFLSKVSPEQMSQYKDMLGFNILSILSQQFLILIVLAIVTGPWVLRYAVALFPAYFTAFSTRSSIATMEVTMALSKSQGVREEYREFVIPFGATVNMNGTAAHVAFWVCALAFSLHPNLSIFYLWIYTVFFVILTAMGTAAIPGGSIALLKKVAPSVFMAVMGTGIEEAQLLGLIGLITVFDIIGDAFRTQANVFGDTMCMAWLEKKDPLKVKK